ncbi:hypothetical protein [Paracoccus yeei]|uniref:hypothetical protein n=1 Tax=Paracoccus yeei TaxID=147645 RepID=UPI003BF90C8E
MKDYWIKRAKIILDLEDSAFQGKVMKCPPDAVSVDCISIEPDCTETRTRNTTIDMKPACVLELNACDTITLLTVFGVLGWIGPRGLSKRAYDLIYQNPEDGIRTAIRAGLGLRAPGECQAWVNLQLETSPALRTQATLATWERKCAAHFDRKLAR